MSSLDGLISSSWRTYLYRLLPILKALAFISLVFALARPQLSLKEEEIKAEGIDIIIAMDISTSMLAEDFTPNRIEVSKALAQEFVSKREHDRLGIVVFGGEAYTQTPLTTDHDIVNNLLSQLECGILKDGTAIGMGLSSAVNRLKESEAESKVIVLLTDGVNNSGYVDPRKAAEIATEFDIKVYTIGIGSNGVTSMPNSGNRRQGFNFRRMRAELDEQLLYEIAQVTGGTYFRATTGEDLKLVYDEIDKLEKTEIEVNIMRRYTEEFRFFLIIGLILLGFDFLLRKTLLHNIP